MLHNAEMKVKNIGLPFGQFVSNPARPTNDGVSWKSSMTFEVVADISLGAGPPPVFLLSWRNLVNSLFAAEWRFFHFSRTSVSVRLSTPTAFTAAVISDHTCFFFKLVTLLVNLLCRMDKFSSTFSVKIEISEALKLCFLGLRDPSPEAILARFAGCKQQTRKKIPSVLWDANLELVTVNPRLTNLSFNPALNNAILTRS